MARYLDRDRAAVAAGVLLPLAVAAVFLPLRSSWSNTNMALVLVVAVVAVAAMGNRLAGVCAKIGAHTPRIDVVAAANEARTIGADALLTGEPQDERTACRRIRPQRRPQRDGSARDQGWQAVWHRAAHLAGAELPPRKFAAILQNPAGVQRGLKSLRHPKQEAGRTA